MADEAMLAMAGGDDDTDAIGLPAILAALPHLTGDELRRVAEAMPRVAGEWMRTAGWAQRYVTVVRREMFARVRPGGDNERAFVAQTWVEDHTGAVRTEHDTREEAEEAATARLRAAGVALCGEVVDG